LYRLYRVVRGPYAGGAWALRLPVGEMRIGSGDSGCQIGRSEHLPILERLALPGWPPGGCHGIIEASDGHGPLVAGQPLCAWRSRSGAAMRSPSSRVRGSLLVGVATAIWASGGLFTRLLPFDLWTIVFWRGIFAAVFVGAYVTRLANPAALLATVRAGRDGLIVMLCSAATIILFPAAFMSTSVANAFTILAALPFVTAPIAWVWIGERPSASTIIASLIALAGILIMVGPNQGGPTVGDALAFLGTLTQAVMVVAVRRNPGLDMVPMAFGAVVLSVLISFPLAAQVWDLGARDYVVAAGFGLGPMALGMMLYIMGSSLIPAALSALISTLEAPLGALWAWIGVGEVPAPATLVGGAIVFASVLGKLLLDSRQRAGSGGGATRRPKVVGGGPD
jgi:drug/metabolite transporter (DMT)-like permease